MYIVINKNMLWIIILALAVLLLFFGSIYGIYVISNPPNEGGKEEGAEYSILIEIEERKLYLFEGNDCIKRYPIASGKTDWPSPIGEWEITDKGDWGEWFGGRWMGLNVKWGNYGIHGTTNENSIGHPASHGCIRMLNRDVKQLYNIVPIGTPVVIQNGPFGAFGTGFRNLKPGDRGADILAVQKRLIELGLYKGEETGVYEDDLKKALYEFQKQSGLRVKFTITRKDYLAMGFEEFE